MTERTLELFTNLYYNSLSVHNLFYKLLTKLDQKYLTKDTLVVFTSFA